MGKVKSNSKAGRSECSYLLEVGPILTEMGKPFMYLSQFIAKTNIQLLFVRTL